MQNVINNKKNIYTKETLNNLKQKNIKIIKSYKELIKIIDSALSNNNKKEKYTIGIINDNIKIRIERDLNEKVFKSNQYSLLISNDSINHVSKHFYTYENIAKEIMRTIKTIHNYDKVSKMIKDGELRLIFEKGYSDGFIRTIETASKSNNSLNLVSSYYINKNRNQVCDAVTTIFKGNPQSDSISSYIDNTTN